MVSNTVLSENNLKVHFWAISVVIVCRTCFNINSFEWMLLIFAIGIVVVTEIVNTAIERLVDFVSPDQNPSAGLIKDVSASAVMVASVVAASVGVLVFWKYLS